MQGKIQDYVHVVHTTEEARRAKYRGCVSRQTLRRQLMKDEQSSIRQNDRKMPHSALRKHARMNSHTEYRFLSSRDLKIPDLKK
mgnify:CR=1 FL=1